MALMTPGMLRVMTLMLDAEAKGLHEDAELACDALGCWVGTTRTSRAVVRRLLRFALVQGVSGEGGIERYALNASGRSALRRPEILAEIAEALASRGAYAVVDDRLVPLTARDVRQHAHGSSPAP